MNALNGLRFTLRSWRVVTRELFNAALAALGQKVRRPGQEFSTPLATACGVAVGQQLRSPFKEDALRYRYTVSRTL